MKKKFSVAALLLAGVMMVTGCSESILSSGTSDTSSNTESKEDIWTAADDDLVAYPTAEGLTDEQKKYFGVTFKDFYTEYGFISNNLGLTDTKDDANAQLYRQSIIEMLVHERVILKKAEEMGLADLTKEEMDTIDKNYQENMKNWHSSFTAQAASELGITVNSSDTSGGFSAEDQEKIDAKAKELFNEYIKSFDMTEETFLKWETNSFIEKKVLEHLYKDIKVADDEVDKYINDLIAEAKKTYDEDVSKYEQNTQYGSVWIPEGTRNVKHVFIGISTIDAAEIIAARKESGADQEEIDKLRDEKLAEIKEKIDTAYKKATAESSDKEKTFDAVLKEYSHDYNSSVTDQTITIVKGTSSLTKELYDAIYNLEKPGDISEIVATDTGYYFFYYVGEENITDSELEAQKKNVYNGMLTERQNEKANTTIEEWLSEVKYEYDYEKLNFPKPKEENTTSSTTSESSK